MEAEAQSSNNIDTLDGEPLMVDNQTKTSNQVLEKAPDTTQVPIMDELTKLYSIN